jgi:hypothetical protein
MLRLIKALHIGTILLLILCAGEVVVAYGLKLARPSNSLVRYWQPGVEVFVGAVALLALLGLLACSMGIP